MSNEYTKTMLMDRIVKDIQALDDDVSGPDEPKCSTREPVKRGLSTLLEVQKAKMEEDTSAINSIKVGNITITGTVAVLAVCVVYTILKVHGIL